jgi:hypothetical protein
MLVLTPLRKEMIAVRHRAAALVSTILALATATLTLPAAASAAVPGLGLQITRIPKTFTVGAGAQTVTAVVSSLQTGKLCRKVRWSMLLQVRGVSLNQVNVERVEDDKPFALRVRNQGDQARLTDVQFDPGTLCAGGTVTGSYRVAFSGGRGTATFQIDALDAAGRVLQTATATSQVAGEPAADQATSPPAVPPTAAPTTDPSPSPSASDDTGGLAAADDQDPGATDVAPTAAAGIAQSEASANGRIPSLLIPGLIVGAVLVFLGVAVLVRLRTRSRGRRNLTPTSFYPAP